MYMEKNASLEVCACGRVEECKCGSVYVCACESVIECKWGSVGVWEDAGVQVRVRWGVDVIYV